MEDLVLEEGDVYIVQDGKLKLIGQGPLSIPQATAADDGDDSGDGTNPGGGGPH